MAAKKVKLKQVESNDISSFASLMARFGARPTGVDSDETSSYEGSNLQPITISQIPDDGSTTPPLPVDAPSTPVDAPSTTRRRSVYENGKTVDAPSTQEGISVDAPSTKMASPLTHSLRVVDAQSTGVDAQSTPSAFWHSKKIDLYLIGFWNVILDVLGTEGHIITLKTLGSRLGFEKSFLHRLLKRLESVGMLQLIPQKDGSFIQVLLPALTERLREEEDVFKKQLPLPFGRDFKKIMALRDTLSAIFWGGLAVGRNVDELSGTTINYLLELSRQRSPEYICGLLVKYIKGAKHPLAFLQTVLQKEPDPLSQIEINQARETLSAGEELLRNINHLDELGLNGIRNLTQTFTGLSLGKTLESTRATLESLQEKHNDFLSKWGSSTE